MNLYDKLVRRPFLTALIFMPMSIFGVFITIQGFIKENIPSPYNSEVTILLFSIGFTGAISFLYVLFSSNARREYLYFGVLEHIPHPIVITSNKKGTKFTTKNKVVYTNQNWLAHYNFTRYGILGKTIDYIRERKPKVIPVSDELHKLLKEDWDRCFDEINEGNGVSRTRLKIPMGTPGHDSIVRDYFFQYCQFSSDGTNYVMIITFCCSDMICGPNPDILCGVESQLDQ